MRVNRRQFMGIIGVGLGSSAACKYSAVKPEGNMEVQSEKADYRYLSISALSRLIQERKVSSTEIVKDV
jgi:hypothetical protein